MQIKNRKTIEQEFDMKILHNGNIPESKHWKARQKEIEKQVKRYIKSILTELRGKVDASEIYVYKPEVLALLDEQITALK